MNYFNLDIAKVMRSEEYIGSEPVQRATWLNLVTWCCTQENGGIIPNAKEWGDRKWQQVCGIMKSEVADACSLYKFEGENLIVSFYPHDNEGKAKINRINAATGGKTKSAAKSKAAKENGKKGGRPNNPSDNPSDNPSETQAITQPKDKIKKDKIKKDKNTMSQNATASAFEQARKIYPGIKRGFQTEYKNFVKHKDWREVLPLLEPAIKAQIESRQQSPPGAFVPQWKNFRTWINQRCWEDDRGDPGSVGNDVNHSRIHTGKAEHAPILDFS